MSGSLNKVCLLGRLGRDPETVGNGKIVRLSLATTDRWTDRDGERKERTEWHRVVIFHDRLVDVVTRYLTKGSIIYIEGKLQTRKWQDQSGADRYSTEVAMNAFESKLVMISSGRSDDENEDGGDDRRGGRDEPSDQQLDDNTPF